MFLSEFSTRRLIYTCIQHFRKESTNYKFVMFPRHRECHPLPPLESYIWLFLDKPGKRQMYWFWNKVWFKLITMVVARSLIRKVWWQYRQTSHPKCFFCKAQLSEKHLFYLPQIEKWHFDKIFQTNPIV